MGTRCITATFLLEKEETSVSEAFQAFACFLSLAMGF